MLSRRQKANAIRALSMDAVQQANSGHPGMPMGMADIAEVLWNDFLQHNPNNPHWANRDRFVLSNGHGSMLLYSLLHLSGYNLSIEDLKQFRQLHSKTPGHPELGYTPGVETTTGPLGQGIANAVGMAIAERTLAAQFNRDDFNIIDHYTYVFAGDGCLMEGISHEACSLAGTLGLGKLVLLYDDNQISIDGKVQGWFTDDTALRFKAYNWHVVKDVDGHDGDAVKNAIIEARAITDRPSIIMCKTQIGFGSPNLAGSEKSHGAPLGDEEIKAAREALQWPSSAFEIPQEYYQAWSATGQGKEREQHWDKRFKAYTNAHPKLAQELQRRLKGELNATFNDTANIFLQSCIKDTRAIATRKASQVCIEHLAPAAPELIGGSADLTGSNLTWWTGSKAISHDDADGNYVFYGVREFAMFAIMNGIALHGGFIPYAGTFLTFVDYGRNALRLAAMMKQRVIYVLTHDSIGLGEDGPTHQPIEHAAHLRTMPGVSLWRPADTTETAVAWQSSIEHQGPTCLLLSRQGLPQLTHTTDSIANIKRGGYILRDSQDTPAAIIIATGSEVSLALDAAEELATQGHSVRVVSMPSTSYFDQQDEKYRNKVLPPKITTRVAVEAGVSDSWYKYVGTQGRIIGIDRYGESAPAPEVYKTLGITVDNVVTTVSELVTKVQKTEILN